MYSRAKLNRGPNAQQQSLFELVNSCHRDGRGGHALGHTMALKPSIYELGDSCAQRYKLRNVLLGICAPYLRESDAGEYMHNKEDNGESEKWTIGVADFI
jgi:hypothetical protein